MMYAVVYLSSKLGQVTGKGLSHVVKDHYARWLLWPILIGALIGNTIEAAADLGGMAAAINLFLPAPVPAIVFGEALIILALQIWGSHELIRKAFRWLALTLVPTSARASWRSRTSARCSRAPSSPRFSFPASSWRSLLP
jgi:Mn2+/Fe2+ NRAMP family transporter